LQAGWRRGSRAGRKRICNAFAQAFTLETARLMQALNSRERKKTKIFF
jgi:hypothetical protein